MQRSHVAACGVAVSVWAAALAAGCRTSAAARKDFSESEVAEVRALLKDADPARSRVVLPRFENGRVVGSDVYGSLPITEVQRLATIRNVAIPGTGNVQVVFANSCNGGGAGSHTSSQTPGSDLGRRIERVLADVDRSRYVLIH